MFPINVTYEYVNYTANMAFYYSSKYSNITMEQCAQTCFEKAVVDVAQPVQNYITFMLALSALGIFFSVFKGGKYLKIFYIAYCVMLILGFVGTFYL